MGSVRAPQDTASVRSVITIAKTLHLAVTGEGIETLEQRCAICGRAVVLDFVEQLPHSGLLKGLELGAHDVASRGC